MATIGTSNSAAVNKTEIVDTILALYTTSVERVAEAQKKALDLALQQNADVTGAGKKVTQATPGTPVFTMLDLAANTFGQYVDLRKGAIDLAVEQGNSLAGLARERVASVTNATDGVWNIVQESVERASTMQKSAIEFSATQTRVFFDTFKKQAGIAGTPVAAAADSMQRGFDNLADTQKEILNINAKRTGKATA